MDFNEYYISEGFNDDGNSSWFHILKLNLKTELKLGTDILISGLCVYSTHKKYINYESNHWQFNKCRKIEQHEYIKYRLLGFII